MSSVLLVSGAGISFSNSRKFSVTMLLQMYSPLLKRASPSPITHWCGLLRLLSISWNPTGTLTIILSSSLFDCLTFSQLVVFELRGSLFSFLYKTTAKSLIILCMWMFCLCIHLVPSEARRRCRILWNWCYRRWWAAMWGTEPWSSGISAQMCWSISPVPVHSLLHSPGEFPWSFLSKLLILFFF